MRYNVGQVSFFINVAFEQAAPRFGNLYLPWTDKLVNISFAKLTCQEHKRVPGEWSDEVEYDGFVFVQEDGTVWHNQFPRASYGQLDCSADYKVRRSSQYYSDDMTREQVRETFAHFTDVTAYLSDIQRGIKELTSKAMLVEANALTEHRQNVELLLKQAYDVVVTYEDSKNEILAELGIQDVVLTQVSQPSL